MFNILNKAIWGCGVLALIYIALFILLPTEVRTIRSALEKDENVNAYFFIWYEGQALSVETWLKNNRYLRFSYMDAEDFSQTTDIVLRDIGDYRVDCSPVGEPSNIAAYSFSGGVPSGLVPKILNENPRDLTLHRVIENYDILFEAASSWPALKSVELSADNEDGVYQYQNTTFQCWKIFEKSPEIPLMEGVSMVDGGHHFFRRDAD